MTRTLASAAVPFALIALVGCRMLGGGGTPPPAIVSPPTFVLAWTGPDGEVLTLESSDGTAWDRRTVHDTTRSREYGPALAHDGRLTWMLMWADGPELQYTVGVGGRPSTDTAGIVWQSTPTVGVLTVLPESSPAVAFANDRWLAVWRENGRIRGVRSRAGSVTSWENAIDVRHGQQLAPSSHAPALTAATINGQRQFVLVYNHSTLGAIAATSVDGIAWSPPVAISATLKDPAIAELNGTLYVMLSRDVGLANWNFVYKSTTGADWREIASQPRTPASTAGPGLAVSPWKLIVTEQIGGALGGTFHGISQRSGTPGSPASDPVGYRFTEDDRPVTAGGATQTVGHPAARTALLYAEPRGQAIQLIDIALTQSGIVDTMPLPRSLVAGKTTLVRASLRARSSGGVSGQIDSARLDVVDASNGLTITSVQGFAFAPDNITPLPAIPDSSDAHFFIAGSALAAGTWVRFDLTLASGTSLRAIVGVLEDFVYTPNRGIPLMVTGFDLAPPTNQVLVGELMHLARIYPVADSVGPLRSDKGVRFRYTTAIPLPEQGSLGSFTDEFVLINVRLGTARGPSGVLCASDAALTPYPGRSLAFNFTVEEDLDNDGVLSPAELLNCAGPASSKPVEQRFANFIARVRSETVTRWNAISNDRPEFGIAVFTFGGSNDTAAQSRSVGGQIGGQCPVGLAADRFCWTAIGANFPALHHELGHAFGLCHADDTGCATASQQFAAGVFGYDLIRRSRVPNPQRLMTGAVPNGLGRSFFTPAEYELVRNALNSPIY